MNPLMRPLLILVSVLVLAIGGFIVFLGVWDIPPPTAKIEKAIPNDRISR
jgi:hypothetical protein